MKKFNEYLNELNEPNSGETPVVNATPQEATISPQDLKWYLNKITTTLGAEAGMFAPLLAVVKTKPIAVKLLADLMDKMGGMSTAKSGQLQTGFQKHIGQ